MLEVILQSHVTKRREPPLRKSVGRRDSLPRLASQR
jgi:hypothetical protein